METTIKIDSAAGLGELDFTLDFGNFLIEAKRYNEVTGNTEEVRVGIFLRRDMAKLRDYLNEHLKD